MYKLVIEKCVNGYIVSVGCKTFVFSDLSVMLLELRDYLLNPNEYIKLLSKKYPDFENLIASPGGPEPEPGPIAQRMTGMFPPRNR